MQRSTPIILALALGFLVLDELGYIDRLSTPPSASSAAIAEAFETRSSDVQVSGSGEVIRVLADDTDGSRHQRFILRLSPQQTILVAHNIDLAPRIPDLASGDRVEFSGEYEWNERGGVLHWTHHDPRGRHTPGWLKHRGKIYQ